MTALIRYVIRGSVWPGLATLSSPGRPWSGGLCPTETLV